MVPRLGRAARESIIRRSNSLPQARRNTARERFKMAFEPRGRAAAGAASHIWDRRPRRTRLNNGAAPSSRGNEIGRRGRKAPAPRPEGLQSAHAPSRTVRFYDGRM